MFPVDTSVRLIGLFTGLAALCEAIAFFGAGLYAYEQTHSTVSVAIVMASVACAETLGAVLGGALADRFDRKRVAGLAALGSAAMLAVLVVGADILWLTVVMTIATLCASPIRPAISAALPNLVVHDELDSANGYVQAWRNGAMTLGPVAVGVGAGLVGARGLFVVAVPGAHRLKRDWNSHGFSLANNVEFDRSARLLLTHLNLQLAGIADWFAIELRNYVSGFQPALGSR